MTKIRIETLGHFSSFLSLERIIAIATCSGCIRPGAVQFTFPEMTDKFVEDMYTNCYRVCIFSDIWYPRQRS